MPTPSDQRPEDPSRWRRLAAGRARAAVQLVRRTPNMRDEPLRPSQAIRLAFKFMTTASLLAMMGSPSGPAWMWWAGGLWLAPMLSWHVNGVRHRWWAPAGGVASGAAAGWLVSNWASTHHLWSLSTSWAAVVGGIAATPVALLVYEEITHAPGRRGPDAEPEPDFAGWEALDGP